MKYRFQAKVRASGLCFYATVDSFGTLTLLTSYGLVRELEDNDIFAEQTTPLLFELESFMERNGYTINADHTTALVAILNKHTVRVITWEPWSTT